MHTAITAVAQALSNSELEPTNLEIRCEWGANLRIYVQLPDLPTVAGRRAESGFRAALANSLGARRHCVKVAWAPGR